MSLRLLQSPSRFAALRANVLLFVRCLLILVITLDLVSSPLHAHHHDGAAEGYALHVDHLDADDAHDVVALDEDSATDFSIHVAADDTAQGHHSLSTRRSTPLQGVAIEPVSDGMFLLATCTLAMLLAQPVTQELTGWHPRRERVPIPSFRTVPPDGRAPPTLHV